MRGTTSIASVILFLGLLAVPGQLSASGARNTKTCNGQIVLVHDSKILVTSYRNSLSGRCKFTAALPPRYAASATWGDLTSLAAFAYDVRGIKPDDASQLIGDKGVDLLIAALQNAVDDPSEDATMLIEGLKQERLRPDLSNCFESVFRGESFKGGELVNLACAPDPQDGMFVLATYRSAEISLFIPSGAS